MQKNFAEAVPKLGFGLMRLPMKGDEIDLQQVCEMVDLYMQEGIGYFDTSFIYGANGASERAAKAALVDRYPRESYLFASKLPAWAAKNAEEAKQMFYTSLERTGVGYFDFFLLHNLGEQRTQIFEDFGLWEFLLERKREGLIRHIGFSFHDNAAALDEILTRHPEVEFVQLQINYADWDKPDIEARKCYEVACRRGKPVIVMEPVKGGILANPPERAAALLREAAPDASPASWALRFAASLENVMTVLSGMSNIDQLRDNVSHMRNFRPLDDAERRVIVQVLEIIDGIEDVPCTSCAYCAKGCPIGIPIPNVFSYYNIYKRFGDLNFAKGKYNFNTSGLGRPKASACVKCGQCEEVCPQHIHIREELEKVANTFES